MTRTRVTIQLTEEQRMWLDARAEANRTTVSLELRSMVDLAMSSGRRTTSDKLSDNVRQTVDVHKKTRKASTQLSDNWQPNDAHMDMADKLGVVWFNEAGKFRDYHNSKGTTMKDWDAAFRTWLRNAAEYAQRGRRRGGMPDNLKRQLERVERLERAEREGTEAPVIDMFDFMKAGS